MHMISNRLVFQHAFLCAQPLMSTLDFGHCNPSARFKMNILLFFLSFFGNFLVGKSVYLSDQVSESICEQHQKFTESGEIQQVQKSGSDSRNDACGWYQVKNGKDAGCAASIATFIECRIIEQRQSPDFSTLTRELAEKQEGGRIVGGEDAEPHEFPSIVGNRKNRKPYCSSTIISPQWVVTAAHCVGQNVTDPSFELTAGQHKQTETDEENPWRQKRKIVAYQIHEKYSFTTASQQYDIAVLKVDPPFEFNENVKAATLPDPEYRVDGVFTVSGWGLKSEGGLIADILQKVDVPFVDDAACNASYGNEADKITQDMICAGLPEGGKDSCQGDSGGPMYKIDGDKQILAGIVSWGTGCARPGLPGVYTEVAYFIEWIKKHTCIE